MSADQALVEAFVARFFDTHRESEIRDVVGAACKGKSKSERAQIMIAVAKARVTHAVFRRRIGYAVR